MLAYQREISGDFESGRGRVRESSSPPLAQRLLIQRLRLETRLSIGRGSGPEMGVMMGHVRLHEPGSTPVVLVRMRRTLGVVA